MARTHKDSGLIVRTVRHASFTATRRELDRAEAVELDDFESLLLEDELSDVPHVPIAMLRP